MSEFRLDIGLWDSENDFCVYAGWNTKYINGDKPAYIFQPSSLFGTLVSKSESRNFKSKQLDAQCYQLNNEVHEWMEDNNIDYKISLGKFVKGRGCSVEIIFDNEENLILFKMRWL